MHRLARAGLKACATSAVAALILGIIFTPAVSAQQSVSFSIGAFTPFSEDSRISHVGGTPGCRINQSCNEVLANNLDFLVFNIKDFNGASFGGEYLVGLGNIFEAGLGVGFYSKSVSSVYADFVNANGTEIEQQLKLRVIPFSATIRVLPLGNHDSITPYVGGGVGVVNWRYTETGQFLATDNSIFQGTFVGSGTTTGPVILGGVRGRIGNVAPGFEVRYQKAEDTLPADQEFAGTTAAGVGPKIDLGGFTYAFTVNVRF